MYAAQAADEEVTEGIFVGAGHDLMWIGMVPRMGAVRKGEAPGTLAAMCALEPFKEKAEEHDITKLVLIWNQDGNA